MERTGLPLNAFFVILIRFMSGVEIPKPAPSEVQANPYEQLRANVEKRAQVCAGFSRRFFEKTGVSADDVAAKAKEHFGITIDVKDDKSLALGTFDLQQKLSFPAEQNGEGCDGMFGPYTNLKLEEFITRKTATAELDTLQRGLSPQGAIDAPATSPAAVTPALAVTAASIPGEDVDGNEKMPRISMSQCWTIGDSLSVGYTNRLPKDHIPASEIKRHPGKGYITRIGSAVGGSLTEPMYRRMRAEIEGQKRLGVKTVVISGGVNDLGSGRTTEHIIKQLSGMARLARANGMKVVMCTIPSWNIEKYVTKDQRAFCAKHGMTVENVTDRMYRVNMWIKEQEKEGGLADTVADLYRELGRYDTQEPGLKRSDSIHFRDYASMAETIIREANVDAQVTRPGRKPRRAVA